MLNEWCMEASGRSLNHPVRAPYNKRINSDRPRQVLLPFHLLVNLSFYNKFDTLAPAGYALGRYTAFIIQSKLEEMI